MRSILFVSVGVLSVAIAFAKTDWKQGVVCAKDGLCVQEPNYDAVTPARFNLVLINRSTMTLNSCRVEIPLLSRAGMILGSATAYSSVAIAPGEQFWFRAPQSGGWYMAPRAEFHCLEGNEAIRFRYPVFSFWREAHAWHKHHENDPGHGRDPNQ